MSDTYLYMNEPKKTGLIYTKYTCLHYGTYLLLYNYICTIQKSVVLLHFSWISTYTYDDISDAIQITDQKLLHFKLLKSGQILCVD